MLLTTHQGNIAQIRACINAFGDVWVHGDGNVFPADDKGTFDSDNHKNFHNPNQTARDYRLKFTRDDMANNRLPQTKEQLDNALLKAKNQELIGAASIQETTKVRNVRVEDADFVAPAGDIDYSKYTRK